MPMLKNMRACWFVLLLAPGVGTACSDAPLSMGNSGGAAGAAGSGTSGSAGSGTGGSSGMCPVSACGPQLGIPNTQCADGSIGGPTGRCLPTATGSCGWEIHQCPPSGTGGSGGGSTCSSAADCAVPQLCEQCANGSPSCATADCVNGQCVTTIPPCGSGGAGGTAGAGGVSGSSGSGGATCGGKVCASGQYCCGPAECGVCVPANSGIACIASCGGSGGAAGSSGAGGSAGADCSALASDLASKLAAARSCSTTGSTQPCQAVVNGDCCPVVVDQASSSATTTYLSAVGNYKTACPHVCTGACIAPITGMCTASSSGAATGSCQ